MDREEIALVGRQSFMVSNVLGDIEPGGRQGLFRVDTRFLSCYRLTLNDACPVPLGSGQDTPDSATFYATNPAFSGIAANALTIKRQRYLNGHLLDEICLANYSLSPVSLTLWIELEADFADIFELQALPPHKQGPSHIEAPRGWQHAFAYRHRDFSCETRIRTPHHPRLDGNVMAFDVVLPPRESWRCQVRVELLLSGQRLKAGATRPLAFAASGTLAARAHGVGENLSRNGHSGGQQATNPFRSAAAMAYEQALADLNTLYLELPSGESILGAGLPYFMTLFGRDSIIATYQLLSVCPDIAANVLQALARYQGTCDDPATDQEPGKIPHEVRHGELASVGRHRDGCYYGTIDATPLFLVLLSEYVSRTGDDGLLEKLWPAAEAALAWIDRYGDSDGDGFVEYQRRAEDGLENQGWKDSWDAISHPDGQLVDGPIALCEVQGYVYDAKRRMARLYEYRGNKARAAELRAEARALQCRFESAFWLPQMGIYALALDGAKRPISTVASNAAHCLWSGIASPDYAAGLVARLSQSDCFSGWGLRTLSTQMARYNPVSYHNGSVWPHDTVLAAEGFLRYGHIAPARRLLTAVIEATSSFPNHRLPELFAGFPRDAFGRVLPYPDANAPQAWASGAIVLASHLLDGIEHRARRSTRAQGSQDTKRSALQKGHRRGGSQSSIEGKYQRMEILV